MQTPGVLTRPYCLLELYTAVMAGRPIVGVTVSGGAVTSYDFGKAHEMLLHLDTMLDAVNPGASDILSEEGIGLQDVSFTLSAVVPKV